MNYPKNLQLRADYILAKIGEIRREAVELFTNKEIRLQTRLDLLYEFGKDISDTGLHGFISIDKEYVLAQFEDSQFIDEIEYVYDAIYSGLYQIAEDYFEYKYESSDTSEILDGVRDRICDQVDQDVYEAIGFMECLDAIMTEIKKEFLKAGVKRITFDW